MYEHLTEPDEVIASCERCEVSANEIPVRYFDEWDDWYCRNCRDARLSDEYEEREAT